MSEDKTFRHMKRTPTAELIAAWKGKNSYLNLAYAVDYLEFDKFCKEHEWSFSEGLILLSEEYLNNEQERINKHHENLEKFKKE